MPGHRSGLSWPESIRARLASLDTTELASTDDLHQPTGPALAAMDLAAHCFGAGKTWFLTNGSTGGILTLLAGLVGRGRKIILPRTCHLAVSHALALLDIEPVWLEFPRPILPDPLGFLPVISANMVADAIALHPDSAAVFLTSPDYYGRCADLAAISPVVHQAGLLLLVDEAHGAHFAAAPGRMPQTALASGADACVQSAHKTLPALTQGGYLHLAEALIGRDPGAAGRITAALKIFQTSSPSFAIAASLDFARAYLEKHGREQIEKTLNSIQDLATALWPDYLVSPATANPVRSKVRDPLRIVIRQRDPLAAPATQLARLLSMQGIDIELSDLTRLVLIPSLDQPGHDFERLRLALSAWLEKPQPDRPTSDLDLPQLEQRWLDLLVQPPERVLAPGSVLLEPVETETIALASSEGSVMAQAIAPYPPGIPLLLPGERMDQPRLDLLLALRDNGINLSGVDHDSIRVVV